MELVLLANLFGTRIQIYDRNTWQLYLTIVPLEDDPKLIPIKLLYNGAHYDGMSTQIEKPKKIEENSTFFLCCGKEYMNNPHIKLEYDQIDKYLNTKQYPSTVCQIKGAKKRDKAKEHFRKSTKKYRFFPCKICGKARLQYHFYNGKDIPEEARWHFIPFRDQEKEILERAHSDFYHRSLNQMQDFIRSNGYNWFGLNDDIKKYVDACETCLISNPIGN